MYNLTKILLLNTLQCLKCIEEEKLKEWQGQCPRPWFPGSGGCAHSSSGHSRYSRDRAHNAAPPPHYCPSKEKKKKESSNISASDSNSLSQLQRCYTTREPSSRNWSDVWYSHLPATAAPAAIGKWEAAAVELVTQALPTLHHLLYPPTTEKLPKTAPDAAVAHNIPVTLAVTLETMAKPTNMVALVVARHQRPWRHKQQ